MDLRERYTRRVRRMAAWSLLAAAVLVCGVTWFLVRRGPEAAMEEFVAELRARGEPVTLAEMEPPGPEPRHNGASDLAIAYRWLEAQLDAVDAQVGGYWSLHYAGPWDFDLEEPWNEHATAEQIEELRVFLGGLAPFFEQVAAATARSEIVWPLPPSANDMSIFGPPDPRSHDRWRTARQLLEARASVADSPEDRLRAIESLVAFDRRVRLRTQLDHLLAAAHSRTDCVTLRDGIEAGRIDPVSLRGRIDGLLTGGRVSMLPRVLRATRMAAIDVFPSLLDGSAQKSVRTVNRLLDPNKQGRKRGIGEKVADAVADATDGLRFDWRAYLDDLRALDAQIPPEGDGDPDTDPALPQLEKWLAIANLLRQLRSADAAEALARVALAACEHRANHGTWPLSSEDLSPLFPQGVPIDPYSGAPFLMALEADALTLRACPPDSAGLTPETLRMWGLEWRLPPR